MNLRSSYWFWVLVGILYLGFAVSLNFIIDWWAALAAVLIAIGVVVAVMIVDIRND